MPDRPLHSDSAPSVAELMARMAAGDRAAIFALYDHHGPRILGTVRRHLDACGARADHDELQSLVIDVCAELFTVAGSWRPDGGAQPWHWAQDRVRRVVVRHVGIHADSLDARLEAGHEETDRAMLVALDDVDISEVYESLVRTDHRVGLFDELRTEARMSDDELWTLLRFSEQQRQGDPAPAHTLAADLGIRPDAVRQRIRRSRRKLRTAIAADARFAPLAAWGLAS